MLRHAVHAEPARPVTLLYSARTEADFAFRDELVALVRRHPQARAYFTSSRATTPGVYPGRIDAAFIRATVPGIAHSICLLCGPLPMIDVMKTLLPTLGVAPGQIRHEVFEAAVAASAVREPVRAAPERSRSRFVVTCARIGRTMPIAAGQTLLDAADAAGVALESLCRAGVCGTCRTHVTAGDVECASDALSHEERTAGMVLACVATANSNCTIDV
jgi:ferredoxin-NADP reductase